MHLASLVTFVCATLLYRVSAECYTPQPLNRALADLGLQSYASDAQSSQSWNQCTSCEVAVSHYHNNTGAILWDMKHL